MNIKCLLGRHEYTFSQFKYPCPSFSKRTLSMCSDGKYMTNKPKLLGWLSCGTVSNCDRCGKEKEVADKDYPMLLPSQH